jgi:hypothetical protein
MTASNGVGHGSATSAQTALVTQAPPNTALPALSSSQPQQGVALSVSNGAWQAYPPPTFTYQWSSCTTPTACAAITGATAQSYTPTSSDVGKTLKATVTASNTVGQAAATSAQSSPVAPPAPVNFIAPSVSLHAPQQGTPESAGNGFWFNTPTSYSYQWLSCSGSSCAAISGATAQTYTPTPGDVGLTLKVQVTASNADGQATATSSASTVVLAVPHWNTPTPTPGRSPTI